MSSKKENLLVRDLDDNLVLACSVLLLTSQRSIADFCGFAQSNSFVTGCASMHALPSHFLRGVANNPKAGGAEFRSNEAFFCRRD